MGKKTGLECVAYYDEAGAGQGTWLNASSDNFRDANVSRERDTAQFDQRGTNWRTYKTTIRDEAIELTLWRDRENDFQDALQSAYESGDVIGIALMDGPVADVGSAGYMMDATVVSVPETEPLTEGAEMTVSLKPHAGSTFEPKIYKITS